MRKLHDITPPITPELAVWPGDIAVQREVLLEMAAGDHLTLSALRATVHLGAHADAPSHYGLRAPSIEARDPQRYLGPCRVVRLAVPRGERIPPEAIPRSPETERLLVATGTFPDPQRFNTDFAAFSPALLQRLHGWGVRLVGIDTPSVDLFESKELESHHVCLEHDLAILEGLDLSRVPPGEYELIALPLRLVGFDASPVRAVLREIER